MFKFVFVLNEEVLCETNEVSEVMDMYYDIIDFMEENEYLEIYELDPKGKSYSDIPYADYGKRPKGRGDHNSVITTMLKHR